MNCLETVPSSWSRKLILSAVPKDGTAYVDNFCINETKPVSYWGQLYNFLSPIDVTIKVYRAEGKLYTDIAAFGKIGTPCARCLEPAKADFSGELKYLFSLSVDSENRAKAENAGASDGDEDMILLDSWEDEVELSAQIWEVVLTSLPAVVLCQSDCKGLCPECGANLNLAVCSCKKAGGDARFEVLKQFIEEN